MDLTSTLELTEGPAARRARIATDITARTGNSLLKMVEFWSSAILISGRYHGNPLAKHRDLAVTATHFDRWLSMFCGTLRDLCPPAAQLHFSQTAERIAFSLARGIAGHAATPVPVVVSTGDPR